MAKSIKEKWFTRLERRSDLLNRITLLNLFTLCEYDSLESITISSPELGEKYELDEVNIYSNLTTIETTYILLQDSKYIYGLERLDDKIFVICLSPINKIPIDIYEQLYLENGDIENYNGTGEFTTYGKYLVNYFNLASIFKDIIPYINTVWSIKKVEDSISAKVLDGTIEAEKIGTYLDHAFFLGSLSELSVPVYSKKSLTSHPDIDKIKADLLEEYKDQLHDPVVCAKIEDTLISIDKEYLKGDVSMGFFGSSSKKFNVQRKRQHLAVGLVEEFSKTKGKYVFIEGSLINGWEKSAFPTLCNDIRKGSYSRGIETAQGGVQTKYLLRIFQNTKIVSEDCGTKRTLSVKLTKDNVSDFYGHTILKDNDLIVLTSKNKEQFLNSTVQMRSMLYCEEKDGFCFTCAGDTYRSLDIKAVGATALELGAAFLLTSMKAMHGTKMDSLTLSNLDEFVIG